MTGTWCFSVTVFELTELFTELNSADLNTELIQTLTAC